MGTPRIATRLGYVAVYAAVGASFPYLAVLFLLAFALGVVAIPILGLATERAPARSVGWRP